MAHPIILYDGICGLCNRLVYFVLRRDRGAVFRFASLQSPFANGILGRHGVDTEALDTVYVVINHDEGSESLLSRSEAALYVLNQLGGFWGFSTRWFRWLPRPVRELAYRVVARHRYRIFGKFDSCPLPWPDVRQRFVDR